MKSKLPGAFFVAPFPKKEQDRCAALAKRFHVDQTAVQLIWFAMQDDDVAARVLGNLGGTVEVTRRPMAIAIGGFPNPVEEGAV